MEKKKGRTEGGRPIYVLKHPEPGFTGYYMIDFSNGIGSTSVKSDRDRLIMRGFKDITEKHHGITLTPEEKSVQVPKEKGREEGHE